MLSRSAFAQCFRWIVFPSSFNLLTQEQGALQSDVDASEDVDGFENVLPEEVEDVYDEDISFNYNSTPSPSAALTNHPTPTPSLPLSSPGKD